MDVDPYLMTGNIREERSHLGHHGKCHDGSMALADTTQGWNSINYPVHRLVVRNPSINNRAEFCMRNYDNIHEDIIRLSHIDLI
jgi:hypothetical protein